MLLLLAGGVARAQAPQSPPPTAETPPPAEPPVQLRGQLLARGTRAPIVGAGIYAVLEGVTGLPGAGPSTGATTITPTYDAETDAEGRFLLRGLPPGTYTLVLSGAGLVKTSVTEKLSADTLVTVRYFVDQTWASRYQSEVRSSPERQEVSRQTLTTEELLKMPGTFGDPLRAVENLPGMARAPFNTGLFIIRGGRPTDSRSFFAGAEVPQLYHFGGTSSVIPGHLLEKIDYMPGNFSVRYGRAIAGVVDIDLRAGRTDRLHGYVDINAFDGGVAIEGPIGKGSFILGARRSYVDAVLAGVSATGLLGKAPLSFVTAPVYYDYQAVFDYPLGGGRFRAMLFGSDDTLRLLFTGPQNDPSLRGDFNTHILFHRLQLRWTRTLGPFSFYVQNSTGYNLTEGAVGTGINFHIGVVESDSRLEVRWKLSRRFKLLAGVDAQLAYLLLDAKLPLPPREGQQPLPISVAAKYQANERLLLFNVGAYVEAQIEATDRLAITPGIRFDYFGDIHSVSYDPRIGARYQLFPYTALKAGVGLFSQDPQPPDYDPNFGNPNVRPEHALHYALSVEQGILPGLSVEATVFYKQLYSLISPSLADVQRAGKVVAERDYNTGSGQVYGAEILLRQVLSRWFFGWISYTLMRSERRDCDPSSLPQPSPGQDCSLRLFDYDQTHVLIVALHANLPRGFEVGVRFRYITGYPYTLLGGGHYDADGDVYAPGRFPANNARLDGFHQLDIRLDKTFIFERWLFKLYLDLTNVYNRANPEQMNSSFDYSRRAPLTGLPFLPSFGIRGEF